MKTSPVGITPSLGACALWGNALTWACAMTNDVSVSAILESTFFVFEFTRLHLLLQCRVVFFRRIDALDHVSEGGGASPRQFHVSGADWGDLLLPLA